MTVVARITFLVLVAATFSAFFVAQRLKSAPPVISVDSLGKYFSPNGDGSRDSSPISITLKKSDDATIDVVTDAGDRVRRLEDGVAVAAGRPLRLEWDGKGDDGRRVPDGLYRVRVTLRGEGRSAVVQKTMTVDTRPPRSQVCIGGPCSSTRLGNIISQGDRAVKIYIKGVSRYPTRFRVLRTDAGEPREVARFALRGYAHRYIWDGLVGGRPLDPGTYVVQAAVRDSAGNVGVTPSVIEAGADIPGRPGLTVRGLTAQPPVRPVTAGGRVEFFVDSRSAPYRWRVRRVGDTAVRRRGSATDPNLVFRAPDGPSGVYLLELRSGRWHTQVPFLVQAEKRSSVLLVVPAISWLGSDSVDDAPFDGVPNRLGDGGQLRWPRMFVGDNGLPAGFAEEIAPLLVFLDRRRIRYDLTSDIDLDLTRNPRATDRPGVLLAGSMRWVTRPLGRRLRRYVADGGRVAILGADSLRRGVRLRVRESDDAGTLSRPTQPAAADPFGARIATERRTAAPVAITQFDGDDNALMEGALRLPGFTRLEESASLGPATLLAAVGQDLTPQEEAEAASTGEPARELRPALTMATLGKGRVIRVGLPEWTRRLEDPSIAQVTRNIVDILRGVPPRIRSQGGR